ncbi:MAG: hypothetical protein A3H98_04925 [Bacteroidetes bacterium RIFCSPLOWO2_02_FULL_36_8]|nr:MAG: hypothetical protein A3H98_04925 [Bacteroidetes bacterium RIFCSPLOWO2_02_FULL_36_8]OFY71820.1 MAG: hypothetical protein A3G23_14545 [Bacteroidetes bacterium RIFCSPLOWO2_12_FULL_37_12]
MKYIFFFAFIITTFCGCYKEVACPGVKGGTTGNVMTTTNEKGELVTRKVKKSRNGLIKK